MVDFLLEIVKLLCGDHGRRTTPESATVGRRYSKEIREHMVQFLGSEERRGGNRDVAGRRFIHEGDLAPLCVLGCRFESEFLYIGVAEHPEKIDGKSVTRASDTFDDIGPLGNALRRASAHDQLREISSKQCIERTLALRIQLGQIELEEERGTVGCRGVGCRIERDREFLLDRRLQGILNIIAKPIRAMIFEPTLAYLRIRSKQSIH